MAHKHRIPVVSLIALGIAMPAMAQGAEQTDQSTAQTQQQRDVVVVTAQRREESVQDIAIAVTAITSELRDEIGLTTVQDYTNFAPGLTYSTSNDRLGMRGVTRTSNNFGIRSGISNYVDGVYFSSAIPASREPIFVDRVEVVRGPQGTLYGRDSIGGALNVISKRPRDSFEGQFNMAAGNYDNLRTEFTVAGPLTDWLRYRVGYSRSKQGEGFLKNYANGDTEGGRRDDQYWEVQLEGDIGERIEWWVRYGSLEWDVRYGAPGARTGVGARAPYDTQFFNSTADIAPNPWFGLIDPGRVQVGNQNTNPAITDRYGFNTDFANFAALKPTTEIAVETVWRGDYFDIKYLGGYVHYNYNLQQDHDGSPIKQFNISPSKTIFTERVSDYTENRGWYSNEITFTSTWDGPLQMLAGLYQYQEDYNQPVYVSQLQDPGGPIYDVGALTAWMNSFGPIFNTPAPASLPVLPYSTKRKSSAGPPIPGASLVFHTNNRATNDAYGVFVQADYELNDQWKLTGGLRWSRDTSDTREYARIVNHYVIEAAFESGYGAGWAGPFFGGNLAASNAFVAGVVPVKIDVTSTLGGVDPATGQVAKGIQNVTQANPLGIYYDAVTGNRYRDMKASWEEVTGVLGVDWKPDLDTLVYAKYNRGYKPGGFGAADVFGLLAPTPYVDKELVDAFELGLKRDWRDQKLTTNAVAFLYDYQGYQVVNQVVPEQPADPNAVRPNPYTTYLNLPEVQTIGFELETMWYPTDNLRFIFNYGYANPEIQKSPPLVHAMDPFALDPKAQPLGAPATIPPANVVPCSLNPPTLPPHQCQGVQGQSLKGNMLPFNPKHKLALNGTYTWFFDDGATLAASASYFWQGKGYSSIFNRPYTAVPAWDQTDARLSWTSSGGGVTLIGFVRNLFDEVAYDSFTSGRREGSANQVVAPQPCFSSPATTAGFGAKPTESCYVSSETLRPPRTYGVELQLRF